MRGERDRFVALAFCWADLLLELDSNETVVFAAAAPDAMMWRQMPTTERTMVPAATRRPGELDLEPAIRERINNGPGTPDRNITR